ncbi:MFS transporter [Metabacillus mangrovi]|uniref:MFS transporter n=1 Tax=Metabacillus mangrovi TaxID=1491830 RepID=UPI00139084DD|nr:MFS transporter [Metabacillus mangrovi]
MAAKKIRPYQTFYFSFSWMLAVSQGFFLAYLISKGYSNTAIGWILAINTITGIAGQIGTGILCDWLKKMKSIFIIWVVLLSAVTLLLYTVELLPLFITAVIAVSFFQSALIGLIDSWIIETDEEVKSRFGEIRAFGSLGFGISMIVTGGILSITGYWLVPYLFFLFALLLLAVIRTLENPSSKQAAPEIKAKDLFRILQNRRFLWLNWIYILFYMLLGMIGMYTVLLIEQGGGTAFHIGLFTALVAFSEIPMFFLARTLVSRWTHMSILLAAILFMLLRIAVLFFFQDVTVLILSGVLQGITMPLFMTASKQLTDDVAAPGYRTTMQMVSIAAYLGIGGGITSALAGWLSDTFTIQTALIGYTGLNIFAAAAAVLYLMKYYKPVRQKEMQEELPL